MALIRIRIRNSELRIRIQRNSDPKEIFTNPQYLIEIVKLKIITKLLRIYDATTAISGHEWERKKVQ
jgi:hypothetical protein